MTHDIYHSIGNDVMDMLVQTASRNSHYYTSYTPASADMSIGHTSSVIQYLPPRFHTCLPLSCIPSPFAKQHVCHRFPRRRYLFAFPVDLGVRYLLPFCRVLVIPGSPTTSRILTHCLRSRELGLSIGSLDIHISGLCSAAHHDCTTTLAELQRFPCTFVHPTRRHTLP